MFSMNALGEQEKCDNRILQRVAPKWVNHSERALYKHNVCSVKVFYNLSSDAKVSVIGSMVELEDCKIFRNSAEASVNLYRFAEGTNQKCIINITFMLEPGLR